MLSEYISKKLKVAEYEKLNDGTYWGEVPGIKGVWANAENLERCRNELQEVLEDWLLLKVSAHERVPGFAMKFDQRQFA